MRDVDWARTSTCSTFPFPPWSSGPTIRTAVLVFAVKHGQKANKVGRHPCWPFIFRLQRHAELGQAVARLEEVRLVRRDVRGCQVKNGELSIRR